MTKPKKKSCEKCQKYFNELYKFHGNFLCHKCYNENLHIILSKDKMLLPKGEKK